MNRNHLRRPCIQYGSAGLIAAVLAIAPLNFAGGDLSPGYRSAVAKGGGNGGAGNGGGHGNAGGQGGGLAGSDGGRGHGRGMAGSRGSDKGSRGGWGFGFGRDKPGKGAAVADRSEDDGHGLGNNHGAVASALGRLNAAHASPTARAHAAPHSAVGMIAAYEQAEYASRDAAGKADAAEQAYQEALDDPDVSEEERAGLAEAAELAAQEAREAAEVAAEALAAAANKEVTDEVVAAVNDLLGIPADEPEAAPR